MRIKKLSIRNIRSYLSQEFEFPLGSLLLAGDVGSGKTTILLAIEFALFGLQPGQKGSALLRNNAELGEVTLELEIQGNDVIIERKIRRGNKSIASDYCAITINGEKVESSVTELKTKVLSLLGYPSEFVKKNNLLYKYTVYTPQEQMKQIILEDSETRLNVLRHIFGIDKYKQIRENLSVLLTKLKEDTKFLQGEIRSLEDDKKTSSALKKTIEVIGKGVIEQEKQILGKKEIRKRIEKESQELEEKLKEIVNFEKEVEKTQLLLSTKNEGLSSTVKELSQLEKDMTEIGELFNQSLYDQVISELNEKKSFLEALNSKKINVIARLDSVKSRMKEQLSEKERIFQIDMCPTCLQNVPAAHKHNILNKSEMILVESKKEINLLETEKDKIESSILSGKKMLNVLEEKKSHLQSLKSKADIILKTQKRKEDLSKRKETLENDIILLSKHFDSLKEDIAKSSKFKTQYKLKQDELKKAFMDEKQSEIMLAELKKELEMTQRESRDLSDSITRKEESKKLLAKMQDLMAWLSNQFTNLIDFTERNVLMKLRIEFSKLFNEWFHMLAGESFEVQIDENFTPLILQGEIEMEYDFLSGGERTAVALAYRLALNQTINSVMGTIKTKDIIILDEPTEGFSDLQLDKIRDVLEELTANQIIIVSHEQKIEGFVDNVLRIKKEVDSSYLDASSCILAKK